MNVEDFGKGRGVNYHPTPPYGSFNTNKKDIQSAGTFFKKGKQFKDSQDLMGGPQYHAIENLSKENRAAYAKAGGRLIEEGKLWSEGRYHS